MLMKELLDLKSKKKVAILEKIFYSENHSCPQVALLEELEITYPTLRLLVETINKDIYDFGYVNFSIVHSPANQLYSIAFDNESSVQMIVHAYIHDSPKFKLLELLLVTSFDTLQDLADKLFISYVTVRKEIREINQLLEKYSIYISVKNGIDLKGDELGVRLYFTILFVTVYGGEKWPFSFISYFEVNDLLKKCPREIYRAEFLDKSILVHYYVAIHLLRVRLNKNISQSYKFYLPLYQAYSDESQTSFNEFLNELSNYVPNINKKNSIYSTKIILSVILAFGGYSSIGKVPRFFYADKVFKESQFLDTISFIYNVIKKYLLTPLTKEEEEKLIYSLMSTNYRHFLFKNISLDLNSIVFGYQNVDKNGKKTYKIEHLKRLINQFINAKEFQLFEPEKKELFLEYLYILDKRIDFTKQTRPIKVVVISIMSNELTVIDLLNNFSDYYNLCVVDKIEKDVDLIVSDFPLSNQTIRSLSIKHSIVYVNTRLTNSDYESVNQKLKEIATEKFVH